MWGRRTVQVPTVESVLKRASRYERNHVRCARYLRADDGLDYCPPCARKAAAEKGTTVCVPDQSADHDTVPTCDRCNKWLRGCLTSYGLREELNALEESFNPRKDMDCWLWSLCETAAPNGTPEQARLMALLEAKTSARKSARRKD